MTTRMPTAERKAQIVDAAIKIIGEKGLREFTAAQIGREVGIKDDGQLRPLVAHNTTHIDMPVHFLEGGADLHRG